MCLFCQCFKSSDDTPTSIKIITYRRKRGFHKASCANEICSICRDEFINNEKIYLTPCNHGYHKDCLGNWLTVKSNCPMCQYKFDSENFEEHTPLLRSYSIDV